MSSSLWGKNQAEISTKFCSCTCHVDTFHWAGQSSLWQSHSLLFNEDNWIQEVKLICKWLQFSLQTLKLKKKKKSSYFYFNLTVLWVLTLTWTGKDDLLTGLFRHCPVWSLWEHLLGTLWDLEPCRPQTPILDTEFQPLILFYTLCQAIEPWS